MDQTFVEMLEKNAKHAESFSSRFDDLLDGQQPQVVTVCCSDSRVLQDHMWGNEDPGAIFTCGNIGNRVIQRTDDGPVVSGDVLYPIQHTDTRAVVVVGHTGCGAVTAAYDDLVDGISEPDGIECCLGLLEPTLEPALSMLPDDLSRSEAINRLVEYNVDRQVEFLVDSDVVPDDVHVVGAVYDFQDVYSDTRGKAYVINVDGETDVEALRAEHPEVESFIERLWAY